LEAGGEVLALSEPASFVDGRVSEQVKDLVIGSWTKQGLPFFSGSVRYHTEVTVPTGGSGLRVDLGEWEGSVATISLDGQPPTVLGWAPCLDGVLIQSKTQAAHNLHDLDRAILADDGRQ
jgi:hypothetical protein